MQVDSLRLDGLLILTPRLFSDERGFFIESYRRDRYVEAGIDCEFVQDNHSWSRGNVVRGMHFQSSPGQAKLIHVTRGRIFDVAVDIRVSSETFGDWEGIYLDAESQQQLFIPVGFAHGFCTLDEGADVAYKCSTPYNPKTECGFRWNDPDIGVEWPIDNPIVSERDQNIQTFQQWARNSGIKGNRSN